MIEACLTPTLLKGKETGLVNAICSWPGSCPFALWYMIIQNRHLHPMCKILPYHCTHARYWRHSKTATWPLWSSCDSAAAVWSMGSNNYLLCLTILASLCLGRNVPGMMTGQLTSLASVTPIDFVEKSQEISVMMHAIFLSLYLCTLLG